MHTDYETACWYYRRDLKRWNRKHPNGQPRTVYDPLQGRMVSDDFYKPRPPARNFLITNIADPEEGKRVEVGT